MMPAANPRRIVQMMFMNDPPFPAYFMGKQKGLSNRWSRPLH
jgi:hypothetical protein